jgi:hypothetical protein
MEVIAPVTTEEVVQFIMNYQVDQGYGYLNKPLITDVDKKKMVAYFEGKLPFNELRDTMKLLEDYPNSFILSGMIGQLLNERILTYPSVISERVYRLQLSGRDSKHLMMTQTKNRNILFAQLLDEFNSYDLPVSDVLSTLFNFSHMNWFYDDKEKDIAKRNYVLQNREATMACLPKLEADVKAALIPILNEIDPVYFLSTIQSLAADSSKAVREAVVQVLIRQREENEFIMASLQSKKQMVRECAIRVLTAWNDEKSKAQLKSAYATESNEKLKSLIESAIKGLLASEPLNITDLEQYCLVQLNSRKTKLDELPWTRLPKVRVKGLEDDSLICLEYLAGCYAGTGRISVPLEAIRLAEYFHADDMGEWCLELLTYWLEGNADNKKKWVLPLCAYHGDNRIVAKLKAEIDDWPLMGRSAIACEAVRALAVSDKDVALRLVDFMSRKFKSRSVRVAAEQAFAYAASEQGIDPEELADRIIPDFGFSQRGELTLDYGNRTFDLRLNAKLEIEIYDTHGKLVKALPKPGVHDDEEQANAAQALLKSIKKELKATAKSQLSRIQSAMTSARKWKWSQWRKCFVDNPLMQQYAIGLIWTISVDGQPMHNFRYLEDGTLNSSADEAIEIPVGAEILLAHPIELDEAEIGAWMQQLEDYEISQPLPQLLRTVYPFRPEKYEENYVETFSGRTLSGLTLAGRLLKLGWTRGPTGDGGMIDSFFREEPTCGYFAELTINGMYVALDAGFEEDVEVYELVFFSCLSGKPGEMQYSRETSNLITPPSDVPPRFFSDIMQEVEQATAQYKSINENWKQENWRRLG